METIGQHMDDGLGIPEKETPLSGETVPVDYQEYSIPIQICIGEISLTLRDILDLSDTGDLNVALPEREHVDLLLAGEPIARAAFTLAENSIQLKIIEVLLHQEEQTCDNGRES